MTAPEAASRTATGTAAGPGALGASPVAASTGLLVLRVVTGVLLAIHGVLGFQDPSGRVAATAELGAPFPTLVGWASIVGEAGLGLLLVLGLLTRIAGALVVVLLLGIWVFAQLPQGLITPEGVVGENALLYAVVGLSLVFLGPGRYSLDSRLQRRRSPR